MWSRRIAWVLVACLMWGASAAVDATEGLSVWVNASGDSIDERVCFQEGEQIYVFIRVPERVTEVQICDFVAQSDAVQTYSPQVSPESIVPGVATRVLSGTITGEGPETLLLTARTQSGVSLSASCSFEITPYCEGGMLWDFAISAMLEYEEQIDVPPPNEESEGDVGLEVGIGDPQEGCNACYHAGQRINVRYSVSADGSAETSLRQISQAGATPISLLKRQTVSSGAVVTTPVTLGSGDGEITFLLRSDREVSGWETRMCDVWVRPSENFTEDFETRDLGNLPWQAGYTTADGMEYFKPWSVTSDASWSGSWSASSGTLADDEASCLCLLVSTSTPGTLSFRRKVSSEAGYDELEHYVDGVMMGSPASGEVGWERVSYDLAPGTHHLCWVYRKDGSESRGQDRAWIDDVKFQRN